jgi:hypothetical protein
VTSVADVKRSMVDKLSKVVADGRDDARRQLAEFPLLASSIDGQVRELGDDVLPWDIMFDRLMFFPMPDPSAAADEVADDVSVKVTAPPQPSSTSAAGQSRRKQRRNAKRRAQVVDEDKPSPSPTLERTPSSRTGIGVSSNATSTRLRALRTRGNRSKGARNATAGAADAVKPDSPASSPSSSVSSTLAFSAPSPASSGAEGDLESAVAADADNGAVVVDSDMPPPAVGDDGWPRMLIQVLPRWKVMVPIAPHDKVGTVLRRVRKLLVRHIDRVESHGYTRMSIRSIELHDEDDVSTAIDHAIADVWSAGETMFVYWPSH